MELEEALKKIEELSAQLKTAEETSAKAQENAEKRKQERIETEKKLSDLAKQIEGVDPAEYAKLKAEAEERETKELEAQKNYEALLAKQKDATDKLKAEREQEQADNKAQLTKLKKTMLFTQAGGKPDQLDNFLDTSGRYLALDDDTKELTVLPGTVADDKGTEITVLDDAVKHLSKNSPLSVYFEPESKAKGSPPPGGPPGSEDQSDMPEGITMIDA